MNDIQTIADSVHVKHLGRTLLQHDILWCALSGSGAEFIFTGTSLKLLLAGDDTTKPQSRCCFSFNENGTPNRTFLPEGTEPEQDLEFARVAVLVNGVPVFCECLKARTTEIEVIHSTESVSATITILKLSEAPMSVFGISQIITDAAAAIKPALPKAKKIEIIGDSITCGYGVEDENQEHHFSTSTENVMEAYSYLTAKALDADYSMVSYSGYGIISGYTENDQKLTNQLVPDYYSMVGYSRGLVNGTAITLADWDFSQFVPDVIVINLGTNDDSYCKDNVSRQEEFTLEYVRFLETVREKNPSAYLLCAFGIMLNRIYPCIEQAVRLYRKKTGDTNISAFPLTTHSEADGYVADWHPSKKSHRRAADELSAKLKTLLFRG